MEIPQRFVVNERSAVSLQQATTRDDRLQHHLERVDLLFGDAEPRLRSHHATGLRKRMKRPDQYVL